MLNIVRTEDDDEITLKKLGKRYCKSWSQLKLASECASPLLNKLLSNVHSNFLSTDSSPSLPSIMVGNIVASVTTSHPTPLQIAFGVLIGEHKSYMLWVAACRGATSRSGLRAAQGASRVDMFVSRLDCDTTSIQLKEHLSSFNIDVFCIESLETKHHSYASFKITIPSNKFRLFWSDQVWPEGTYTRKFYGKRNAAPNNPWWSTATMSP